MDGGRNRVGGCLARLEGLLAEALSPLVAYLLRQGPPCEVPFQPNRLMLHDTTCLPALADFAGMRDAVSELGGDPANMNPTIPVRTTASVSTPAAFMPATS